MRYYISAFFAISVLFASVSCGKKSLKEYKGDVSFYYWKNAVNFTPSEFELAKNLNVKHLYLKVTDIDWDEAYGNTQNQDARWGYSQVLDSISGTYSFTPVIFIANKVIERLDEQGIEVLSEKMTEKYKTFMSDIFSSWANELAIKELGDNDNAEGYWDKVEKLRQEKALKLEAGITELQVDCDWTAGTRDKFFLLLKKIKSKFPEKKLSCTVRLWQYKYRQSAGIPPADRGMLMCYNLSDVKNAHTENSILEYKDAEAYIKGQPDYPLPLDAALPLFGWGAIHRGDKFLGLVNGWNNPQLFSSSESFEKIDDNRFRFKNDTVIGKLFVREGDEVRIERASLEDLNKLSKLLHDEVDLTNSRITFFDWNQNNIQLYGIQEIKSLVAQCRR